MQYESQKLGEDPREDPTIGTPEEDNKREDRPNFINVVQQNAIIISGRGVKVSRPQRGKSNSERWL